MNRVNQGSDGTSGQRPTTSVQQDLRLMEEISESDLNSIFSNPANINSLPERKGLLRRRKKSLAYERAHHLIEWLDDPRMWLRGAERCFDSQSFLICIDFCRQALQRLKRYEGPNRVFLRHTIEWTLAQSLHAVNAVEEALHFGSSALMRDPKNKSLSETIARWEKEVVMPPSLEHDVDDSTVAEENGQENGCSRGPNCKGKQIRQETRRAMLSPRAEARSPCANCPGCTPRAQLRARHRPELQLDNHRRESHPSA